jgi:hypothetical protein
MRLSGGPLEEITADDKRQLCADQVGEGTESVGLGQLPVNRWIGNHARLHLGKDGPRQRSASGM